ncbi:MAG TPA: hypothetical protein VFC69_04240 [Dysgonamonadaceae bacterium]|nr:hypothetical protein [Dysgonamonadaceae bacterium]
MESINSEMLESLKTILSNFKSCISGGNGELETDKEDIRIAEFIITKVGTLKKSKQMDKRFYMNYAEGQKAPTVKYESEDEARIEAERLAEKLGVEVITLISKVFTYPKDITKRVRTYEDACEIMGVDPINEYALKMLGFNDDEIANRKLKTIVAVLNDGWSPTWSDTTERKYYPYFKIEASNNGARCGLACAYSFNAWTSSYSLNGARLAFKNSELAEYAGNQFKGLYETLLLDVPSDDASF